MRVVIAGAGIGGLTTALSLHAAGIRDVTLAEAATDLRQLGVGLNILPHAAGVLGELHLLDRLTASCVQTRELLLCNRFGDLIWREPRGKYAGHDWPQLSVHRADLVAVLAQAVRERLGDEAIRLDSRVVHVDTDTGHVHLSHRGGRTTETDADVVVGADGIRSAVRAQLYPDEGQPSGNGLVMWRGTSVAEPFLTGRSMVVSGDDVHRVVTYPVRRFPDGKVLVNWVAARPADLETAVPEDALRYFGDWTFEWLDIPAILDAADDVRMYPMVDREPLPRWSFGRTTLLGDAAHAMYPMGSNGATQAILDAAELARVLAAGDAVESALAEYERARRPATTRLQASNRAHGPERVIALAHQRAPTGFDDIHDVIPPDELAAVADDYAAVSGLDQRPFHPADR